MNNFFTLTGGDICGQHIWMRIGHFYTEGQCEFVVWAPFSDKIDLSAVHPEKETIPMERDGMGYWKAVKEGSQPGMRYFYRLDNDLVRPDPASHYQPEGVHGASQVVDHNAFRWEDLQWTGISLPEMIMYEIHTGTFTEQGTFEGIIGRLDDLKDLGVNSLELMPVAQFPGKRNWGYDGTYPFSPQNSYGGPEGLKRLVNECHKKGLAVILDVVYNHLGPEGNYLNDFGPYFTDKYKTPWGNAVNFDDAYCNHVRNFFIENALYWFMRYHIDALRLDAVHAIYDMSARPFLQELAEAVAEFSRQQGRDYYIISESDLNDSKVIRPRQHNGYGHDAQWSDDLHHSIHTLLTGEKTGYYADFGRMEHLAKAYREGFVYSGQYSNYRKRNHGNASRDFPGYQFVVCSQNHDQIGNRMLGERLSSLVSFEALKLAAAAVILSPCIPLLFMGEEYGEDNPFLFFVHHSDRDLINAVRKGREAEFKAFAWKGEPPDPQSEDTFLSSRIEWDKRGKAHHKVLLNYYRELLKLRKVIPSLSYLYRDNLDVSCSEEDKILVMRRWKDSSHTISIFNFNKVDIKYRLNFPEGNWGIIIDSSDKKWNGQGTLLPGSLSGKTMEEELVLRAESFALYASEDSD